MNEKLNKLSYWSLFVHTLFVSAFTVGGGYVMIPMLRERFVEKLHWLEEDDLATIFAMGQSAPGALVINSAVIMGYRLLGVGGAICAALGTALPAVIVIILVSFFYELIRGNAYVDAAFRGMRAGVVAIITDTVITMATPYFRREKALYASIMAAAFLAGFLLDINVGFVIIGCGLLGAGIGLARRKWGKAE